MIKFFLLAYPQEKIQEKTVKAGAPTHFRPCVSPLSKGIATKKRAPRVHLRKVKILGKSLKWMISMQLTLETLVRGPAGQEDA